MNPALPQPVSIMDLLSLVFSVFTQRSMSQSLLRLRGGVNVAEAKVGAVLGVGGKFVIEVAEMSLKTYSKTSKPRLANTSSSGSSMSWRRPRPLLPSRIRCYSNSMSLSIAKRSGERSAMTGILQREALQLRCHNFSLRRRWPASQRGVLPLVLGWEWKGWFLAP